MKAKEIREKNSADLPKLVSQLRQDLAMTRLQFRAGHLANTAKIDALKRDLARVLTIQKSGEGKSK